jgi:protein-tyrosine phosphatase
MNKIIDRFYVGDWNDAQSLKQSNPNEISSVLNVCENIDDLPAVAYLHAAFKDHETIPKDKFDLCMIWLNTQYSANRTILVHCALGVSRSPTICAAFLTKLQVAANIDAALTLVRSARPQVNPAPLTWASAKEYLNGTS